MSATWNAVIWSTSVCWIGLRDELVVVTLWEEGEDAVVPRRFTDALRRGS
jgi:hypothetical protein